MPPSQLKRLKASLHTHGITAAPTSKSKKRRHQHDASQRASRDAALHTLRESLNPFDVRRASRGAKRDVTTARPAADVLGRPAASRSAGEEVRRRTLRGEVERRLKVGGVVDRRGEGESRVERVQRVRAKAKRSAFDLEGEDVLTHLGRAVGGEEEEGERDDFDEESLAASEDEEDRPGKRRLEEDQDGDTGDAEEPLRKKSRKEIMEEVIAKSKLHKFERQQARENDDALREELDKGLGDLKAALLSFKPPQAAVEESDTKRLRDDIYMNPDRAALLNGTTNVQAGADYEQKVRELAQERRSQPSERTKTEEERKLEEAERQKQLDEERLKRMTGEDEDEPENEKPNEDLGTDPFHQPIEDDAAEFGFKPPQVLQRPPGFEDDEDEFVLDDDLVADESDVEDLSELASDDEIPAEILALANGHQEKLSDKEEDGECDDEDLRPKATDLKVRYDIPLSPGGIQILMANKPVEQVPEIIRRIRAQYDPSLSAANKPILANFAQALVAYLRVLSRSSPPTPLEVTEQVIRHIHSMSRTFATEIAETFRDQLDRMHKNGIADAGDLTILTAIGSIYPTSDHFHQVVTPAMTVMARWLELTTPKTAQDFHMGAYLVALVLKYQALSRRYVPEAVRFTLLALRNSTSTSVLKSHVANLRTMADIWHDKSAFIEIFTPTAVKELHRLGYIKELHHIAVLISQARLRRRPLGLHHHRPLPIKAAIPRFEEGFNPERFYDPDTERSEATRLRKEYKKERKGAMRELRKDANFLAREQLKEKKERDRAYEEKYRKLVASVQAEEGREANEYRKEKKARKSGRKEAK